MDQKAGQGVSNTVFCSECGLYWGVLRWLVRGWCARRRVSGVILMRRLILGSTIVASTSERRSLWTEGAIVVPRRLLLWFGAKIPKAIVHRLVARGDDASNTTTRASTPPHVQKYDNCQQKYDP